MVVSDGQASSSPELNISPRCIVVVRFDGVHLQQPAIAPAWRLGLPDLHMLALLSAGRVTDVAPLKARAAVLAGCEESDLSDFMFRMRLSGNLQAGVPSRSISVPDRVAPSGTPPYDLADARRVSLRLPMTLRPNDGAFELIDHAGYRTAALAPAQVAALALLVQPVSPSDFVDHLREGPEAARLGPEEVSLLLARLRFAGVLDVHDSETELATSSAPAQPEMTLARREEIVREAFDRHAAAQTAAEREREAATGRKRVKVIPVAFDMGTPTGVGSIVAYAKAFDGGRLEEHYDFRTDWVWSDDRLDEFTAEPAIYLFSNYLWSHKDCIEVSRRVKERSPGSITIHGGPDTPKYEADAAAHLEAYPHVDVMVRGEGEATAAEALSALVGALGPVPPDLSRLADVAGLTYRSPDGPVRTADRERIADVTVLPSPFLTGLFDPFIAVPDLFVTIETNRGCPYGCTFCDWGSATTSRIRKFDIEQVLAEIDWCAYNGVGSISVADANFGIFERDIDIARHVAARFVETGHPKGFGVSYAKNTVKHLREIIAILCDAGIMSQGVLSLQTMDEDTLQVVHRSNIKTDKYDAIAQEMRRAKLPLMVELMMGLPGQTVESFADDLQQCINREVPARINHTTLLVNSPMNEPSYLAEHKIETASPIGPGLNAGVISTASYTRQDYAAMEHLRKDFMLYENWSVLRHISRFVRQETGIREIDVYRMARSRTDERPGEWPILEALVVHGATLMTAPFSWSLMLADLRRFLVSEAGVPDDSALDAMIRTQLALLPSRDRKFPEVVELPHDVVAWNRQILAVKSERHLEDWESFVPRLIEFGPGTLTVDDPDSICDTSMGINYELNVVGVNWELDSPLSRASVAATQFSDYATDIVLPRDRNTGAVATGVPVVLSRGS